MATNESCVLVVRSITNAMKGQKLLEQHGITAYVQRNTAPAKKEGCGYVLKVNGSATTAVSILSAAGISISEVRGG